MNALPLFRWAMTSSWRSLLGWAIGLCAVLCLYLPLFPSLAATEDMQELLDSLPQQLIETLGYQQITTGPGYVQATFFGLMGYLLLTIAGVAWGSAAIAGDEESGTLELTLAHATTRTRVVVENAAALLARLLILTALCVAVIMALDPVSQTDLVFARVVAAALALLGVCLLSGMASLAVGAICGRRLVAIGVGAGVAVTGYIANALGGQVEGAEWLKDISPYSWAFANTPLMDGVDLAGLAGLYGVNALLVVVAVIALNRRTVIG